MYCECPWIWQDTLQWCSNTQFIIWNALIHLIKWRNALNGFADFVCPQKRIWLAWEPGWWVSLRNCKQASDHNLLTQVAAEARGIIYSWCCWTGTRDIKLCANKIGITLDSMQFSPHILQRSMNEQKHGTQGCHTQVLVPSETVTCLQASELCNRWVPKVFGQEIADLKRKSASTCILKYS